MQRIPPIWLGERFELVAVTVPDDTDDVTPYVAELQPRLPPCPHCGTIHALAGSKQEMVADLPYGDHPVLLKVNTGRTYCRRAKHYERYDYPREESSCTDALYRYLLRRLGHEPHRHLAQRVGLSPSQVHRLQRQQAPDGQGARPERVTYLGLDDLYIFKGQHLIAIDLAEQKILALQSVGTVIQGRAGQIDIPQFLKALPDADIVTLDMHASQMAAAKQRWPDATFVIDKRHLLQILDRDLIAQAEKVILGRSEVLGDPVGSQQAVKTFGIKAYPYLALRTLVLRRQHNLAPADLAAWTLLRREGGQAQVLWESYQWREALYNVYDARLPQEVMVAGLQRWRERLCAWQNSHIGEGESYYGAPLGRIRWALETYWDECLAYARTGVTNASTERINSQVRRYLRRGHRYGVETLVHLVNRDSEQSAATGVRHLAPAAQRWVLASAREDRPAVISTKPSVPLSVPVGAPVSSVEPSSLPQVKPRKVRERPRIETPKKPRHLPKMDPGIDLAPQVWNWLHSPVEPHKRLSLRWTAIIGQAAADSERDVWQLLSAGQMIDRQGREVTVSQLCLWRVTVLNRYLSQWPHDLNAAERQRHPRLQGLDAAAIGRWDGRLLASLDQIGLCLSREKFFSLSVSDKMVLDVVEAWHRLAQDASFAEQILAHRSKTGQHLWDSWRQHALRLGQDELVRQTKNHLDRLTLKSLRRLLTDDAVRQGTAVEWVRHQHAELPEHWLFAKSQRLAWLEAAATLINQPMNEQDENGQENAVEKEEI